MAEAKIILNMMVPGAKMFTKEVSESNHKEFCNMNSMILKWKDKNGLNSDRITYTTRKCVPAKQVLQISRMAYDYMISEMGCTNAGIPMRIWKSMGKTARLEAALKTIALNFNAISHSYQILDD